MYSTTKFSSLALAVSLLGACAGSPAPSAPVATAPAATAPAATAGAPVPAGTVRTVKVLIDPAPGEKDAIKTYWNYGRDFPFQINNYTATGTATATSDVNISASVQLPSVTAAKSFQLLQDDEVDTPADNDPDEAPTAGADDFVADEETVSDEGNDGVPDDDVDNYVPDEDIDEDEISMGDYLEVDPDVQSPELLGEDPELPDEAEVSKVLSDAHEIEVTVDDDAAAGSYGETATYTDKTSGQTFTFSLGQAGEFLTLTNNHGSVTFAAAGGGVTLNGQALANATASLPLLQSSPVMQAMSPFALSLLVARLERKAAPKADRSVQLFVSFQATPTTASTLGRGIEGINGTIKNTMKFPDWILKFRKKTVQ